MPATVISKLVPVRATLISLPSSALRAETVTDFEVYLEVGGHMVLYAPPPYHWTNAEISRLIVDGFSQVFYDSASQEMVNAYRHISAIRPINESLPPRERIGDITDVIADLTRALYVHPLSHTAIDRVQSIARSLSRCVQEDITCVQALGKLADHDYYTYYHSARVAAYALALAIKMSQHSEARLEEMTTGCLLHDIGKSKVGLGILNKPGALTPQEWLVMKQHPTFGSEILGPSQLGLIPRAIILHHHERLDGRGYPHGLTANEILDEVKIAAFADLFDAMTTDRPYQKGRSRYEALDFIRFNMLDQVHRDAFRAMVEILIQKDPKP